MLRDTFIVIPEPICQISNNGVEGQDASIQWSQARQCRAGIACGTSPEPPPKTPHLFVGEQPSPGYTQTGFLPNCRACRGEQTQCLTIGALHALRRCGASGWCWGAAWHSVSSWLFSSRGGGGASSGGRAARAMMQQSRQASPGRPCPVGGSRARPSHACVPVGGYESLGRGTCSAHPAVCRQWVESNRGPREA